MITLHYLNNSRSQRILWLLEELGLDYKIERYERDKDLRAPEALKKIHPLGKSPILQDGDLTLIESGAIVEFMADKYGSGTLAPSAASDDRLRYITWLHFAEGSAMPPLTLKLIFDKVETSPAPFVVRPILKGIAGKVKSSFVMPEVMSVLDYLEGQLKKSQWFVGDTFTAADIQMSFPIEVAAARGGLNKKWPKLMAYLDRIHARPAYQKALEVGGAYEIVS